MKSTEFKKIVKTKILQTGIYKGRNIQEAEDDSELYYYLSEIKKEYTNKKYTLTNADSKMALDFLQDLSDDLEFDLEDLYGSQQENMNDINEYFLGR